MIQDPFLLIRSSKPVEQDIDIVSELENELRSEKKSQIQSNQSQELNASSSILPDLPGQDNEYLKKKVAKYAIQDSWKPGQNRNSILGDFSKILDMTSLSAIPNSGLARNQLMSMTVSTLHQAPPAERIIESQLAYNLAAADRGLDTIEKKSYKQGKKRNKLRDNIPYY